MERPCKNSRHNFVRNLTGLGYHCTECPITLDATEMARRPRGYPPEGAREAVAAAEREWYIKELES